MYNIVIFQKISRMEFAFFTTHPVCWQDLFQSQFQAAQTPLEYV